MKNTEEYRYFASYERILEKLDDDLKLFNGGYAEEVKAKTKELVSETKMHIVMEAFRRNVSVSELEKMLKDEMPARLYYSYVQPLFYLIKK